MPERRHAVLAFLGCVSLALIVGGGYVAYREAAPLVAPRDSARITFLRIAERPTTYGLSILSRWRTLSDCFVVADSVYARAQSDARRSQFFAPCRKLAEDIAADAPTYTYAWLVAAHFAGEQGDTDALNRFLQRAYETAPIEDWVVVQRVFVAERFAAALTAESRALLAPDRDAVRR